MEPEERGSKTRKSIIVSVITSTVVAGLTAIALPDMKIAFYFLIWLGTFFVWWMWTMMATHY